MFKKLVKLLLVLALCSSFLIKFTSSINAQGVSPSTVSIAEQSIMNQPGDPNIVTWDLLEYDEVQLVGPYDSYYFSFSIPADWKLTDGAELNLYLGVSVSSGVATEPNTDTDQSQPSEERVMGVGTLIIYINDTVFTLPVDQAGEFNRTIPIPLEALIDERDDGVIFGAIILDSAISCNTFNQMRVAVRTSSYFNLPHESVQPSTSLANFPRPIFQDSFVPDAALLVIPDQPSPADLQAALTVAAGFGRLSGGELITDVVSLGKLTDEQKTANDLIFVGNSNSLPILSQLQLPIASVGGKFQIPGGSPDDGLVEMINSPWSDENVVLVVSGSTDIATTKAAQAVSTGTFRPNKSLNLAIVQEITPVLGLTQQPTDQSLSSLGYAGRLLESRGVNYASYDFNIPPGWTVGSDAYFELAFGHSSLINYDNSGIVVSLNGKPIGSVRMTDDTASVSENKVLIDIPATATKPGKNRLDIITNLLPHDTCSPDAMRGLWVNIWPDSRLHLPLDLALINPVTNLGLNSYPAPFNYYPLLDNTAFVLMRNDLESWRGALKMAAFLGANTSGPITLLKVFYSDDLPEIERPNYNFVIIGRPSQISFLSEINNAFPVPFKEDGSDILESGKFQVTYRVSPDSPMGYMEWMPSPWNSDNVIFAVLGNTPQGLNWATLALTDPELRSQLKGNFAVINDQQIITTDTRLSATVNAQSTQVAEVVVIPPDPDANSSQIDSQEAMRWIFPTFIASIILIIVISATVAISSWSRNRTRTSAEKKPEE